MDLDEEVAMELSDWIGGYDGIISLSGVISLSKEGEEGWLAVSVFLWRASIRGKLQPILEVHEFLRGGG